MEVPPTPAAPHRLILGLALFSIVSGSALLIFGLTFLKGAYTSQRWPTAQGKVEAVNIRRDRITDSRPPAYTYTFVVTYAYLFSSGIGLFMLAQRIAANIVS